MKCVLDTADPIILLVDRKLRENYVTAWENYKSTVLTGGTPEQRLFAYQKASALEKRFADASTQAAAAHKRAETRAKAKRP